MFNLGKLRNVDCAGLGLPITAMLLWLMQSARRTGISNPTRVRLLPSPS